MNQEWHDVHPHKTLGSVPSYQKDDPATCVRVIKSVWGNGPGGFTVELNFGRAFAIAHTASEARAVAKLLELAADEAERAEDRAKLERQLNRVERDVVGSGG
jgi:hypothetical protein